ncbi:MAG TPA: redoxin domain-containing protein [Pyrinomonadaceae bacterium]|nr:redoxin domain-containing protein [Pyrinomonadaceae bacterium]
MSHVSTGYAISKRGTILLTLVILTLLVLNASLVIQNRNLRELTTPTKRSIVLKEGSIVPALSGLDLNGTRISLNYQDDPRKAVMLVFSPRCAYCTQNLPNWHSIAQSLDPKLYRIMAVSTSADGVKEYVGQNSFPEVPIIADVDPKSRVSYEMNLTPQTILIDSQGRVEKIWTGVLQPDERTEVERFLGLKL